MDVAYDLDEAYDGISVDDILFFIFDHFDIRA